MKIKFAFTLAEVLITLVVIGVVMAITIPALLSNVEKKEMATALKKVYSAVSNAHSLIKSENSGSLEGLFSNDNEFMTIFAEKMNAVKVCSAATVLGNCWHSTNSIKNYYGNPSAVFTHGAGIITNDGLLYWFSYRDKECNSVYYSVARCGPLYVDVNGFKKPNMIGRDIFAFHIEKNRVSPYGVNSTVSCPGIDNGVAGVGCTNSLLLEKDY